ncbi:histidine kinase [Reichenbachiella sp. MSK19-1]|uniref:tetratricopeptide repeat-containing sensor histidine kinase n=1 Tax=Reichenbachiella sp. MSK19-1 TaxID=1897631 RepID=UPI000E6B687A|nr:histidine kinase [Reichenbachiella sp. MSK19-1]
MSKALFTLFTLAIFSLSCSKKQSAQLEPITSSQDSLTMEEIRGRWKKSLYQTPDSVKAAAEEMLQFAQAKGIRSGIIAGNNMMAVYYSKSGDDKQALEMYDKNLTLNQGDLKGEANIYNNMGNCYLRLGDFDLALEAQIKGLKAEEARANTEGIAISHLNISGVYAHLKNDDKTLESAMKAYDMAQKHSIEPVIMQSAFQIAELRIKQGNDSLGMVYADTVIRSAQRLGSSFGVHKGMSVQAKALAKQGKLSEALAVIREVKSYYLSKDVKNEVLLQSVSEIEFLNMMGRYHESEILISKALNLAQQLGEKEQLASLYYTLSMIHQHRNNAIAALEDFKRYHSYKDSLLNSEKVKAIEDMAIKYETEKKEAEIATLSQQAAIQALELKQKNLAILIGLVVFILVIVIAYFVYRERSLKKERAQTELEQRFLRSQLNPHFIFNALMAIQNFMLKNDGPTAAMYLTKFSKLMREILESSRQEFIPLASEVELITNYLDIHKMRLNDAFAYSIEIDKAVDPETDTIPPMFVQPFVENAIEHGIADKKNGGQIDLRFKKYDEHIAIEITDNGKGLIKKTHSGHNSLASTIIQERMTLFNKTLKTKIQLVLGDIKNDQGEIEGTRVELKVPFSYI